MSQEGVNSKIFIFSDNFKPFHTLKYQEDGNALKTSFGTCGKEIQNYCASNKTFREKNPKTTHLQIFPCLLIMTQKKHSDCFQKQYFRYLHIKKDLQIASLIQEDRKNKIDFMFFVPKSRESVHNIPCIYSHCRMDMTELEET